MEKTFKMLGGFVCPHCKRTNLCDCTTCSTHYTDMDLSDPKGGEHKFRQVEDNGEIMLCAYCNERFSYDESAEAEMEEYCQGLGFREAFEKKQLEKLANGK